MSKLTKQDVLHVAKLAKITLTDAEVDKFTTQLSSIISYMDELNTVEISNIEPTTQTTGLSNVFRKDEINTDQVLSQDEALSGTEKTHNGYFKVDAILTERSDK
ncbi:MAG TPA: Asp-tRNA(Asn)/Glu-tRNA(Gln) amidotransferase subunit GatC [Patescibacteria group bacterium]|nr:Asp-tRNA(Asn)/Glu-tRNA(Gln) amidotransferase subunit GatC [Patescibacteria group bacterium]